MIFIWFFKFILFCLKRFVTFLADFQVMVVLTVLFLLLLFLIYREFKRSIEKIGDFHFVSELNPLSVFWNFLSVIVPGLDKIPAYSVAGRPVGCIARMGIGKISMN